MAASALDAAPDLTAVLRADPRRTRRQVITFAVAIAVLLAMALALLPLAIDSGGLWVIEGILLLVIAFGVFVMIVMIRSSSRRLVAISPRGVFVPVFAEPIPWAEIASFSAVRFPDRVSVGAAGRVAAAAMAAGGVNDGGRDLNVVLVDAASWRARLDPAYRFLVADDLAWEEKGAAGLNLNLSTGSDAAGFESFALALKAEADARGIPILFRTV